MHTSSFVWMFLSVLLLSSCSSSSSEQLIVYAHAAPWGTSFAFPDSPQNETFFLAEPNDLTSGGSDFVGFWFGLAHRAEKPVHCEVNEFYDRQKTHNFSTILIPTKENPRHVTSIVSQGFLLSRLKPAQIRYNFTCWHNNNVFQSAYTIFVDYPDET